MILVGDIHGDYEAAFRVARDNPNEKVIQIGDFGFGFKEFPEFPDNLFFLRGNHDAPNLCRAHGKYLGEFGVFDGVFFVSGARTIDPEGRIEGVSWWRDEELSYMELQKAIDLFEKTKPEIVISHDGPQRAIKAMFGIGDTTLTRRALDAMAGLHRPKAWHFGHHHKSKSLNGMHCLGINEARKIC